ncbi:MAG: hypothetical protein QM730_08165 [Anaerolineales bacterium]
MRTFELNIFIDRPRDEVYEHIAEPINMIGLQPLMTTIDILKEQKDANKVALRPFYMVETYRWLGVPYRRSRIYSVIHLTRPKEELELHVFRHFGTTIVYRYFFNESDEGNRTHRNPEESILKK